jgi:hypothetical protein
MTDVVGCVVIFVVIVIITFNDPLQCSLIRGALRYYHIVDTKLVSDYED